MYSFLRAENKKPPYPKIQRRRCRVTTLFCLRLTAKTSWTHERMCPAILRWHPSQPTLRIRISVRSSRTEFPHPTHLCLAPTDSSLWAFKMRTLFRSQPLNFSLLKCYGNIIPPDDPFVKSFFVIFAKKLLKSGRYSGIIIMNYCFLGD